MEIVCRCATVNNLEKKDPHFSVVSVKSQFNRIILNLKKKHIYIRFTIINCKIKLTKLTHLPVGGIKLIHLKEFIVCLQI